MWKHLCFGRAQRRELVASTQVENQSLDGTEMEINRECIPNNENLGQDNPKEERSEEQESKSASNTNSGTSTD